MVDPTHLDELAWIDRYKPMMNHFDLAADCNGRLFNPQGAEREFVLSVYADAPRTIWTYMDDGSIVSGFHFVNRQGHFICTVPFGEDDDFIINGADDEDEDLLPEDALEEIHAIMDGEDWSPDTLDEIADVMRRAGYVINDTRPPVLEDLVRTAFANVVANGVDMIRNDMTDEQIAVDMLDCDADIEDFPYDEVLAAVTKVRNELLQELADQKHEAQTNGN